MFQMFIFMNMNGTCCTPHAWTCRGRWGCPWWSRGSVSRNGVDIYTESIPLQRPPLVCQANVILAPPPFLKGWGRDLIHYFLPRHWVLLKNHHSLQSSSKATQERLLNCLPIFFHFCFFLRLSQPRWKR